MPYKMKSAPQPPSRRTLLDSIRAQLAARPLILSVPPALRSVYKAWRLHDLGRYLRITAAPLITATLALTLISHRFFTGELDPRDSQLWTHGSAFACTLIIGGILIIQWQPLQRYYTALASLLGVVLIGKFLAMPQLLSAPSAIAVESYFCMIFIVVVCLAFRLTLRVAAGTCIAGGLLGLTVTHSIALRSIDWRSLSYYYVAMTGICLFVQWLAEERDKMVFLQSVLLDADAQEKETLNRELARLADCDSLTGLPNRRTFDRTLAAEWARMRREQKMLAVLFIDIDHFKTYNDHYGHGAGDRALIAVADALRGALHRPADMVARYGGEEFVALLPDTTAEGASEIGERLRAAVNARALPHARSSTASHVTVSIGMAVTMPSNADTTADLLERADAALYAAKEAGRNRVC